MAKRLILFDIDGTLLKTTGTGRRSKKRAMQEVFGITSCVDTIPFGGKTDWQILHELLEPYGYDEMQIGEIMPKYEKVMAEHLADIFINGGSATPMPGAMEAVHLLREEHSADVLIGILTGNCATTAPLKLQAAGYDPEWFPIGAFGSESMRRNDLPALALQRAVAHSGWDITPENVYIIGDTLDDINCARALGAVVIAVGTGYTPKEELLAAHPDYYVDDLTTLMDILLA